MIDLESAFLKEVENKIEIRKELILSSSIPDETISSYKHHIQLLQQLQSMREFFVDLRARRNKEDD